MFVETWYKTWCPACQTPNWFCVGDLTDMTGPDLEACRCFMCDTVYMLDDTDPLDYFLDRLSEEDEGKKFTLAELVAKGHVHTEKGRQSP